MFPDPLAVEVVRRYDAPPVRLPLPRTTPCASITVFLSRTDSEKPLLTTLDRKAHAGMDAEVADAEGGSLAHTYDYHPPPQQPPGMSRAPPEPRLGNDTIEI